jgi:hypothetical protein
MGGRAEFVEWLVALHTIQRDQRSRLYVIIRLIISPLLEAGRGAGGEGLDNYSIIRFSKIPFSIFKSFPR